MPKTTHITRTIRVFSFFSFACVAATLASNAQAQSSAPKPVNWELQVIRDGQQIDSFSATTNVG